MKRKIRRILSMMLVLALLFSTMPMSASAVRCRHTNGTHWLMLNDDTHVEICNECSAHIRTGTHNIYDESQWEYKYYDTDNGQFGTHAQICKKCGYTYWQNHSYYRTSWKLNGVTHPNVLVCSDPKCNHVYAGTSGSGTDYHIFDTQYVNGDYHKTTCVYCDCVPYAVYTRGYEKVPASKVDYNNLSQYYVFKNGAYVNYSALSDSDKRNYTTYYSLALEYGSHKATKDDYEKHSWYEVRNSSSHWLECHGCHAVTEKSGHHFGTVTEDDGWHWYQMTYCIDCGWVKSYKSTSEKNDKGNWINKTERVKNQVEYNLGVQSSEQPRPGHGGDTEPCDHKYYDGDDNTSYRFLGDSNKHEEYCRSCGKVLSTNSCQFETETFEQARRNYIVAHPEIFEYHGADYIPWDYMEEHFDEGHWDICTVCGGKVFKPHNWSSTDGSNATAVDCKRTCKDCGWSKTFRYKVSDDDPSPHTYLTYQDNYFFDADQILHAPYDGQCSYTYSGSSRHRAKCTTCGYESTEKCDTNGWAELVGRSGKHTQFCSKCGGGQTVVSCTPGYRKSDSTPSGYHEVYCTICGDIYIPKTPCQYVLSPETDDFRHVYVCNECGFVVRDNHIRQTVKENVIPATSAKEGSYDLVTKCKICNREMTRSTVKIPKTEDDPPVTDFTLSDNTAAVEIKTPDTLSITPRLSGSLLMDGVSEYLANNSQTLLRGVTALPSTITGKSADGKTETITTSGNSSAKILLRANLHMKVTDAIHDTEDEDGDGDTVEYTGMKAKFTFTYSAYTRFVKDGVEYISETPLNDSNGSPIKDLPFNPTGSKITLSVPLLTGMLSSQTMFVQQTTDGGETYATRLGEFVCTDRLGSVTFSTEDGFDGEFLFRVTDYWLEHVPRKEPDKNVGGNIEYWYSKNTDQYFSDILCTHEITKNDTYLDQNTYTLTFDGNGGTGSTLPMVGLYKDSETILPACGFTKPGYEFYGWAINGTTYQAGSRYTVTGDAVLTAKWHLTGDSMCHIIFHKNADDATGTMEDQTCYSGDVISLHANDFTREGWTFYGWSTSTEWDDFQWWDRAKFDVSADIDLYALWKPNYYINYDANADGVTGTMGPQAFETSHMNDGTWYVHYERLIPNTYVRDGYRFTHWTLTPEDNVPNYSDGGASPIDDLRASDGEITLYAQWERNVFNVTFDKNADDATGEMEAQPFTLGLYSLLNENQFEREGYRFKEWNTKPDGSGIRYTINGKPQFSKDTTLYAIWQKTCTVTFDSNGAEGVMSEIVADQGNYIYLPACGFLKENYSLDSWNTEPDGSGTKYYDKGFCNITEDITLYAQWKQTRFVITYDANGSGEEAVVQYADFATGTSTVCPRCSGSYTCVVAQPDMTVSFCDCCGFGKVLHDEGETTGLNVRSYASLTDYSVSDKFDSIASLYAALIECYPDKDFTQMSGNDTDEYAAYEALYNKAAEVMNASLSVVTKNTGYSLDTSAIVGITDGFVLTTGENEYEMYDTLSAIARLFGYSDTETFLQYAQTAAQVYITNEAGAATDSYSNRLKYEGGIYTKSGSFIFPYAFCNNISNTTVLAYLIIDADGNISLWLSDLSALYDTSLYGKTLPDGIEATLDVYGRCSLYENPRVLENTFEYEGYDFNKWNTMPDGTGTNYTPATSTLSSYSLKENLTLYAQWTPTTYTVTFDANGGEGEMAPQKMEKNVASAVRPNTFTRDGYIFAGWNTYVSNYASIADGGEITKSADTTLYAVWKKLVNVSYDANGGYGTMEPQDIPVSTITYLSKNAFRHDTLVFDYWSLTPDGTRKYSDGSSVYFSADQEDMTLYAVWKTKTDLSQVISIEDMETTYNGEAQYPEAVISFEGTSKTQGSDPTVTYEFYKGTGTSPENLMKSGKMPTDAGDYTVRAIYEDSRFIGRKTAYLKIKKAQRTITTESILQLYGQDNTAALRLSSDYDNSADAENVAVITDNAAVAEKGEGLSYKSDTVLMIAVAYKGEGYTNMKFTLPATDNYESAEAAALVIAKGGYNVNIDKAEGGKIKADRPKAPEGTGINVSAVPDTGYTLNKVTVTYENSCKTYEVTDGSFIMPEQNVTVSAEFTKNEYSITYKNVDGITYSPELPDSASYGDNITLSADTDETTAIKGYRYSYGETPTIVDIAPNKNGGFIFNMPAQNITVEAVTGNKYEIKADSSVSHGNITVSDNKATEGTTITITPDAEDGYTVGAVSYNVNGKTKPVTISIDETGNYVYSIVMPDADITVSAEFIPDAAIVDALANVNRSATIEQGKNVAQIDFKADETTINDLQMAIDAVDVNLNVGGNRKATDEEKSSAVKALTRAGIIDIENNSTKVRVVEKTFLEVEVKNYEQTDDNISVTMNITPMKQTVATIESAGTQLDNENSIPISQAQMMDVSDMTRVTAGIPVSIARAAGGAGKTIYVQHIHGGVEYEYPAVIEGNDTDGYTATFDNPNGYSEFTLSVRSNTVASFEYDGTTYCYTSFAEAVADAVKKKPDSITIHRMPVGDDIAVVTRKTAFTVNAASGSEDDIDFDTLYTFRIETGDDIIKASTPEQLAQHIMSFDFSGSSSTVNITGKHCTIIIKDSSGNMVTNGTEHAVGTVLTYEAVADQGYYFGTDKNNGNKAIVYKTGEITVSDEVNITETAYAKNYRVSAISNDSSAYTYSPSVSVPGSNSDYTAYGGEAIFTAYDANEGYEFIGWYNANNKLVSEEYIITLKITSNTSLYARYRKTSGIVTFMANSQQQGDVFTGEIITANDFPTSISAKYGYEFTGWDKTPEEINAYLAEGRSVTVNAVFAPIQNNFTVTILNGVTNEAVNCTASRLITRDAESVEGKTFAYWTKDGVLFTYNPKISFTANESCTITAVYTDDNASEQVKAEISKVNYANGNLIIKADMSVPDNMDIVSVGIRTSGNNDLSEAAETTATTSNNPAEFVVTKTGVPVNSTLYAQAYVTYTDGVSTTTAESNVMTIIAGQDYDAAEKGTATIRSAEYNSTTNKATFNAYLTVPENAVIVKAGLVAAPSTSFNSSTDVLTDENAAFVKSLSSAEGKCAPVNYTWNKSNINAGDTWYARAYLVYTLNDRQHIVYGSLVTLNA